MCRMERQTISAFFLLAIALTFLFAPWGQTETPYVVGALTVIFAFLAAYFFATSLEQK